MAESKRPHPLESETYFVSTSSAASQSLNINLPVIGGENKQAIKKRYKADFLFPLLSPPFSFCCRLELDVRQWDPELCGILSQACLKATIWI